MWCEEAAKAVRPESLVWLGDCRGVLRELGFRFPDDHRIVAASAQGAVYRFVEGLGRMGAAQEVQAAAARCGAPTDGPDRALLQQHFFKTLGGIFRVQQGVDAMGRASGSMHAGIDMAMREIVLPGVEAKDWHLIQELRERVPNLPADPDLILNRLTMQIIALHAEAKRR